MNKHSMDTAEEELTESKNLLDMKFILGYTIYLHFIYLEFVQNVTKMEKSL